MNVREEFINWMKNNNFNRINIISYSSAIDEVSYDLSKYYGEEIQLYSIVDPGQINNYLNSYLSVKEFKEKNREKNNINSIALGSYERFLRQLDLNTINPIIFENNFFLEEINRKTKNEYLLNLGIEEYLTFKDNFGYDELLRDSLLDLNNFFRELEIIDEKSIIKIGDYLDFVNDDIKILEKNQMKSFNRYAVDRPGELAWKLNQLFDRRFNLKYRIESFLKVDEKYIEFVEKDFKFEMDIHLVGYLLSAYDMNDYAPCFKKENHVYIDLFLDEVKSYTDTDKYIYYLEILDRVREEMKLGHKYKEATIYDAYDYLYSISNFSELKFNFSINYLYEQSTILGELNDDLDLFLSYINSLDICYIRKMEKKYKDSKGTDRLRWDIANYMGHGNKLTENKLYRIISNSGIQFEHRFDEVNNNFLILYPFYTDKIEKNIIITLNLLRASILDGLRELGHEEYDYYNLMSRDESLDYIKDLNSWMIVFFEEYVNTDEEDTHLYVGKHISDDMISYGLKYSLRPEGTWKDDIEESSISRIYYTDIIGKFLDLIPVHTEEEDTLVESVSGEIGFVDMGHEEDGLDEKEICEDQPDESSIIEYPKEVVIDSGNEARFEDENVEEDITLDIKEAFVVEDKEENEKEDYVEEIENIEDKLDNDFHGEVVELDVSRPGDVEEDELEVDVKEEVDAMTIDDYYNVEGEASKEIENDELIDDGIVKFVVDVEETEEIGSGEEFQEEKMESKIFTISDYYKNDLFKKPVKMEETVKVDIKDEEEFTSERKRIDDEKYKNRKFNSLNSYYEKPEKKEDLPTKEESVEKKCEEIFSEVEEKDMWNRELGEKNLLVNFKKKLSLKGLYFENEKKLIRQIEAALKSGKHLVIVGAPATGKTKLAKIICENYGVKHKMITAMPSWNSYDTIGKYLPSKDGDFYFEAGIFLNSFKTNDNRRKLEWLIIDEINRADMDKAFGPLFTVLGGNNVDLGYKAESGHDIKLINENGNTYINDYEYIVPEDFRIIGTLNTRDRASLYDASFGLMRRFAFISIGVPESINERTLKEYLRAWNLNLGYRDREDLASIWNILNKYRDIGPGIIKDIVEFISAGGDYSSALNMYVVPQLEGLYDYQLKRLILDLQKIDVIEDLQEVVEFIDELFDMRMSGDIYGNGKSI